MAGRAITIQFLGDARSFNRTANQVQGQTTGLGSKFSKFGTVAKLGMGAAAAGLGLVAKNAIGLEAEFGKTMNVLGATLDAPKKQMDQLTDLAMKMGAETVFSANDASKAMLELARGGMSAATIQGGALKGTLTLAAAGELDMGTAANTAVKAMGAFNLKGKDMDAVAAALAGGANASAASVADMSQALAQGGLAAHSAGLSLQETTAILASFSNHGLEGSDAGTSLKTMLNNLVPATDKAENAFESLGLATDSGRNLMLKANGEYKSAAQIAEMLKKGTEGLASSERNRLITQAFGTDAQRAANILADEGAKGINKLVKATSDSGAAQKMAAANMQGTAGAIERLKGAAETAQLMLGRALAPVVVKIANFLSGTVIPAVTKFVLSLQSGTGETAKITEAFKQILPVVMPVAKFLVKVLAESVIGALKGLAQAVMGIADVFRGFVNLIDDLFHGRWSQIWGDLKQIASGALNAVIGVFKVWWYGSVLSLFRRAGLLLTKGIWVNMFKSLSGFAKGGLERISGVFKGGINSVERVLWGGVKAYLGIWRKLFAVLRDAAVAGWKAMRSAFGGAMAGIRSAFSTFFGGIKGLARSGLDAIVNLIKSVPGRIANLAGAMLKSGKDFMGKFFEGIKSAASGAGGFVADLAYKLKSAINQILHLPLEVNFDKGPIHIHATVIPALAKGTKNFAGGVALVGEEGPEIVSLPRGAAVHTASQSRRMMGGDTYVFNLTLNGVMSEAEAGRKIEQVLTKHFRTTGRRPAFG